MFGKVAAFALRSPLLGVAEQTATKEKNLATIADAKSAQEAVKQAIAILKEFFAKSAQATVLMQVAQSPGADAPETCVKATRGCCPREMWWTFWT